MASNKKRLYVALYPSGSTRTGEKRYHWAFLVGPKAEDNVQVPGIKSHVKNTPRDGWTYEELRIPDVRSANNLLARIVVAKVKDDERLLDILRNTPMIQNDPSWRCRTWIADALARISNDGSTVGTAQLDWATIESVAREYVAKKTAAGRYSHGADMGLPKPTWDMLEERETVT